MCSGAVLPTAKLPWSKSDDVVPFGNHPRASNAYQATSSKSRAVPASQEAVRTDKAL
jgi:hypothetical protein